MPKSVGALVVAAVAAGFMVHAQDAPQQPQPPRPVFKTEANYVRVDVYPTADGRPVDDLTQNDFEVFEDRRPQTIDAFEHITIRPAGPQATRREPSSVDESRAMMQDPEARLFVVFLDIWHVEVEGSHDIRKPLVDALNQMIGQDDLVAIMTPDMSAGDLTFARRTTTIEDMLSKYWDWGQRDRLISADPYVDQYTACYPPQPPGSPFADQNGIAQEMIDRRHEKLTLDAMQDLVRALRDVREERKAIVAISDGWLLYGPNAQLARKLTREGVPTGPDIGVDPRTGRLTTKSLPNAAGTDPQECTNHRIELAQIDDDREFRAILDEANRANASFYSVDPRGLAVFDTPIVPNPGMPGPPAPVTPPSVDRAMLTARQTSLRTLAEATDGIAVVNTNDLAGGLRRVVSDLSSYYLLGYYSNGRLDGKFHAISVRVKRPGVQVRARRGYLALTPDEARASAASAAAAARAASPAGAAQTAMATAVASAVSSLAIYGRELPMWITAIAGWRPVASGGAAAGVWAATEFSGKEVPQSGAIEATLSNASGAIVASGQALAGPRSVLVPLVASAPLEPGDYVVRVRAPGLFGASTVRVSLPVAPQASGALFFRRGIATGNREVPAADLRFRRSDRIRIDRPAPSTAPIEVQLLDRTGKPLAIPMTATVRDDPDGSRWQTTTLALAPLAPGDYVIEWASGAGGNGTRTPTAFRIVP